MKFEDFGVSNNAPNNDCAPSEALIRRVQKARNLKANFFGGDLFADPAWDMLLELYACWLTQQRISISGTCAAAGVPPTTALRWIAVLEERNLATREDDPLDRRRVWISITSQGASLMHRYFTSTPVASLIL